MQGKDPFGTYDIRGRVGADLDEEFAYKLGISYSSYLCPESAGTFVVGRDHRLSSEPLTTAFEAGLCDAGHDVIDLGVVSTPIVYWYGNRTEFAGNVMVTASHLPAEYNGFKLCSKGGLPLSKENGLAEIAQGMHIDCKPSGRGSVERKNVRDLYVTDLAKYLQPGKPLRIAIDAGGGPLAQEIYTLTNTDPGLTVVPLGFEPDPNFTQRPSNPLDENGLDRLVAAVAANSCDFGVAFDGDGDRAVFVDEIGKAVSADAIIIMIAGRLLDSSKGGTVLYDLRCSRAVSERVSSYGGLPKRTRVGHSFIKAEMRAIPALFAGELSGHYYYADMSYSDNALRTFIEIINCVRSADKPLGQIAAECASYASSGEINLKMAEPSIALQCLENEFVDATNKDYLDGISIDYADWWFNARISRTESLLRITVGSISQEHLDANIKRVLRAISSSVS